MSCLRKLFQTLAELQPGQEAKKDKERLALAH